ncbi:helix-turn-helix transcriptional regulator [Devosia sp. 1566]|uniref:helix-turn-helix domain-containing protein n=1 Tax=Devosia sp. 1566 TaxID=2499144 RepID=UPI000FD85503|nr:helix-turn-helix transcriptional regulator [Devosia sp. 1566]
MSFGALLRTRRNERGLTLEDVAVRVELSLPHLSRIERDRENPPRDEIIEKLAATIGIPADDLFAEARRLPPDLKEQAGEVFALYRRANRGWTR